MLVDALVMAARAEAEEKARTTVTLKHYLDHFAGESAFRGQPYVVGEGAEALDQLGACHLFRFRVGCLKLGKYLYRWRADGVDSPNCSFCRLNVPENRNHFMLTCPKWRALRDEWHTAIRLAVKTEMVDDHKLMLRTLFHLPFCVSESQKVALFLGGDGVKCAEGLPGGKAAALSRCRPTLQRVATHACGEMVRARLALLSDGPAQAVPAPAGAQAATRHGTRSNRAVARP